jgi:hypothetical protein
MGSTTVLSTKALCVELQAAHPGSTWRFFHESIRGRRTEISCSGRLLRDVLPPPLRSANGVTLHAEPEEERSARQAADARCERRGSVIQDEDLLGKLVCRTEAADDPDRQGEKENAKRKLEQYLTRNPEMADLVPRYRAKLRSR